MALVVVLGPGAAHAQAGSQVTQPPQPKSGPGGSDYSHKKVRVSSGGEGFDAWFAFEPMKPRPEKKAPLAIVMHGYGEYEGYGHEAAFIEHIVRKGSVVIYPRWQTGIATPCPGPFDIEPCMASTLAGINGALDHLRSEPKAVQPQLAKTSYFGLSFGGIITTNMANRYEALGLPKPRAIFLEDPHDGGLTGADEPALDDDLGGIPKTTLFQCHAGAEGVISQTNSAGESTAGGSCNSVFPKLGHIPAANKDIVLTHTDTHGDPGLHAIHGVCAGAENGIPVDAYDWNFCWKVWDGLTDCAYEDRNCEYALGDTRKHRSMGKWSDGVPIAPLVIQNEAPITP